MAHQAEGLGLDTKPVKKADRVLQVLVQQARLKADLLYAVDMYMCERNGCARVEVQRCGVSHKGSYETDCKPASSRPSD